MIRKLKYKRIKWLYSGTKLYSGSENKDRTKAGKSSQQVWVPKKDKEIKKEVRKKKVEHTCALLFLKFHST